MRWKKRSESTRRPEKNSSIKDRSYAYYKAQRHTPNEKPIEIRDTNPSRLRLLPSIIAVTVILGSIFYAMTLSTSPKIQLVSGQESIYRSIEEYEQYAHTLMSKDITSYTKFSVNTTSIEQALMDQFPELNGAAVRLPVLGRKPTISISVRQPALLLSNSVNLYVLDKNGLVIAQASDLENVDVKGLKTVRDESGLPIEIGKQAVTSGTVNFIDSVVAQLNDKNLAVDTFTLPQAANVLYIKLKDKPYFIKMDIGSDPRIQTGSYLAVKDELARQGITPTEYIDVRVEEKVFYK